MVSYRNFSPDGHAQKDCDQAQQVDPSVGWIQSSIRIEGRPGRAQLVEVVRTTSFCILNTATCSGGMRSSLRRRVDNSCVERATRCDVFATYLNSLCTATTCRCTFPRYGQCYVIVLIYSSWYITYRLPAILYKLVEY